MPTKLTKEELRTLQDNRGPWPAPTVKEPDTEALLEQMENVDCTCTDGCEGMEADGVCEHGFPSWPLYLGLV